MRVKECDFTDGWRVAAYVRCGLITLPLTIAQTAFSLPQISQITPMTCVLCVAPRNPACAVSFIGGCMRTRNQSVQSVKSVATIIR